MEPRDLDTAGRIGPGTPGGDLVAALLRAGGGRADSVLTILRRHRVPAAAVVDVALDVAPALAGDEGWQEAVRDDRERADRVRRALDATASALRGSPRPAAVLASALGPLWMRDIDLLVGAADTAAIADPLRAAGFLDLGGFASQPGPVSRAFAAVDRNEVLASVDLTARLFPGGSLAEDPIARATRKEPDGLPLATVEDRLRSRAGKTAQARRVVARDALELMALLEASSGGDRDRIVRLALRRCAALEHELGIRGPLSAGAPPGRGALNIPWIRARARGARGRVRSLSRPRRARVSFSGVDGAGKSTQAALLIATMDRVGVPAVAVWARLGYRGSSALSGAAGLAQRLLPARHHSAQPDRAAGTARAATPTSRRGVVGWAWALAVTLDYLLIVRREAVRARGRVVVYDRGLADAVVGLEEEFGGALRLDIHRRLILRWGPVADVVFHLRLPGRTAHGRKEDSFAAQVLESHARRYEQILPELEAAVVTLDAQRPPQELAHDVVRRLALELVREAG